MPPFLYERILGRDKKKKKKNNNNNNNDKRKIVLQIAGPKLIKF